MKAVRGVGFCAAPVVLWLAFLLPAALGVTAPAPATGARIIVGGAWATVTIIGEAEVEAKPQEAPGAVQKPATAPGAADKPAPKVDEKPADKDANGPAAGVAPAKEPGKEPAKEGAKEAGKEAGKEPAKDKGEADDERVKLEVAQKAEQEELDRFFRGADVESDFEADRFLRRARDFATADPPEVRKAIIILQHVIENYADALTTIDERTYRSLRETAERMIVETGPEALKTYRTEVDGLVRALVGERAETSDEEALRTIESRYFLSTWGDEAAFTLGCLYLDHHQYARARRLFGRLLRVYPDLTVPRGAILLRLAVACSRSDDRDGARSALEELDRLGSSGLDADVLAAVRRDVDRPGSRAVDVQAARRSCDVAHVPDLAADGGEGLAGLWVAMWDKPLDLVPPSIPSRYFGINTKTPGAEVEEALRRQIQIRWEQTEWVPAGSALVDGTDVFVKSSGQLICLDADTGQVRWATPQPPEPQASSVGFSFSGHRISRDQPQTPAEFLAFGDRIGKAVSLIGDRVYHIEDHVTDQWTNPHVHMAVQIVNGKVIRQGASEVAKGSRLAVYDRKTGKVVWRRGRTLDTEDPLGAVAFLAPPVVCSGRLLVPVEDEQGGMSLAALAPSDGQVLWRVFLCTRVSSRQGVWDEVGLAADASDVYVATGEGLVFALDGIDGTLHWASRYERTILDNIVTHGRGVATAGWHGNHVFLDGGRLIVLPADAEAALVFDSRSGALVARYETREITRCLDLADGRLWAAGPRLVTCIDLRDGHTLWTADFEKNGVAHGHGFVTRQAVYVPVQKALVGFDRETGRRLTKVAVQTPDDVPLGNVASDGRRFFVLGAGQVYGLTDGKAHLVELERMVAAVAKDLSAAVDRLRRIERELEAERQTLATLGRPIADADHLLAALRSKQESVAQEIQTLDDQIAALQAQRAQLAADGGAPPGDPAVAAARLKELDVEIAEKTARRADQAAQQERLPGRIDEARQGLEQLQAKRDASTARVENLKQQQETPEAAVADIRNRYMHTCFSRARIEIGFERYDKAVATYRLALDGAGDSTWRDEARLALVKAYLAKAEASPPVAALEDLAEAEKAARGVQETLLVRQALAVGYERAGNPERALAMYLEMPKGGADALVNLGDEAESWTVSPVGVAAHGLQTLLAAHGQRLAGLVQPHARQMLEEARQKNDPTALRAVLRMFPGTAEAMAAGLEAAEAAAKRGPFEVAELFLHDMLRSEDRRAQAAGLAHLARMHQDRGWTAQARGEWKRLADEFAGVEIPFGGDTLAADALARRRLADPAVANVEGPALTMPPPPWQLLWKTDGNTARPFVLDADELADFGRLNASQFLLEHVILWMFGNPQRLTCRRLRDGHVAYEDEGANQSLVLGRTDSREGHVAIAQRGQELAAVGLVSGNVLWTDKAARSMASSDANQMAMLHQMMLQGQFARTVVQGRGGERRPTGTLIGQPDPQSIRVLDLATGEVLWERSFRRKTLTAVHETGSRICLVMDGGKELIACDTLTGAVTGRFELEATVPNIGLMMVGDGFLEILHDPKANTFTLRRRGLPSGKVLWATDASPMAPRIHILDRGNLCLLQQGGEPLEIRDLDTGAVKMRCDPDKVNPTNITDVAVGPNGRLLYVTSRTDGNSLDIIDLETGEHNGHYTFGEGPYHRYLPASLYASCGEYLPWAERDKPEPVGNALRFNNLYTVRFLRRSDGKPADDVVLPSSRPDGKFEHLSAILCQDGVLLIITVRGVEAFGRAPPPKEIAAE